MDADKPNTEPFRLLYVCTGNTCRSPLAEAITRRELERRRWSHVEVRSAGTGAAAGQPASAGSERAARRHGLGLEGHRTRPLDADVIAWADVVLVMSPAHLLRAVGLGAGEKAALLTSFAADDAEEGGEGVPDPFGGADEEYEAAYRLLERLVDRTLDRLAPILSP